MLLNLSDLPHVDLQYWKVMVLWHEKTHRVCEYYKYYGFILENQDSSCNIFLKGVFPLHMLGCA